MSPDGVLIASVGRAVNIDATDGTVHEHAAIGTGPVDAAIPKDQINRHIIEIGVKTAALRYDG